MLIFAVVALLLAGEPSAQAARAIPTRQTYAIAASADGTPYLSSPIFIDRGEPDLSALMLDAAVRVTPDGVEHLATGLRLPLKTDDCSLEWLSGLPRDGWQSFEKGGRAYYVCDARTGPAFAVITFESEFANFEAMQPETARKLIIAGTALAQLSPTYNGMTCVERSTATIVTSDCSASSRFNDQPIQELGTFVSHGTSFLKMTSACLDAQCDIARAGMDRLITALGAADLRAVSPASEGSATR